MHCYNLKGIDIHIIVFIELFELNSEVLGEHLNPFIFIIACHTTDGEKLQSELN